METELLLNKLKQKNYVCIKHDYVFGINGLVEAFMYINYELKQGITILLEPNKEPIINKFNILSMGKIRKVSNDVKTKKKTFKDLFHRR